MKVLKVLKKGKGKKKRKKLTLQDAKRFHARRKKRAKIIDEAMKAKKAPSIEYWFKHYRRSDLPGVDMPKTKKKKSKKKRKASRKKKRKRGKGK